MTTTALASTTASNTTRLAGQQQKLADNFDTFLTLLTAQLKNQDPLEPMKSNEFTQQLVQFSSIEQQMEGNKLLSQLVSSSGAEGVTAGVGYIGKTVSATGDTQTLKGSAEWGYSLPRKASSVELSVLDPLGREVFKAIGDGTAGKHTFNWDGKDALGRQLVDGGQYKLSVKALDASGGAITAATEIRGRVRAVESSADGPILVTDQARAPLKNIISVADPV